MLRGLPALLFASAVANCLPPVRPDDYTPEYISEKIVISVRADDCTAADVSMDKDGYKITCDKNHYYQHHPNRDELRWGNTSYYDGNHDGLVDVIYTDGAGETFVTQQPKIYDEKLSSLRKDYVHRLWLKRHRQ